MSFNKIQKDIEQAIADNIATGQTLNGINFYPANYQGKISGTEWVRLNVFPGNSELLYRGLRIYGQIVFNIFVPAGNGMIKSTEIADKINSVFGRQIISGIQTTNSFITTIGIDPVDKGLFRLDLTVNFNNYTQ